MNFPKRGLAFPQWLPAMLAASFVALADPNAARAEAPWRQATEAELHQVIPARAPVEKERIETEFRTASGITDGKTFVAGVVLITAGYSADGKYSHFLSTQVPLVVGDLNLPAGEYVFGWQRGDDALSVKFYQAQSGALLGTVSAPRSSRVGAIESFHIFPPKDRAVMQIGRFAFPYKINRKMENGTPPSMRDGKPSKP